MKELYLSRHGQTLFNKMQLFQGWCDSPLTEDGIAQARKSGKYLREIGVEFDYLACSTLERTEQTLENIMGSEDIRHDRYKGLKEVFFGELEGQTFLIKELGKGVTDEESVNFFKKNGVEDRDVATKRIAETLEEIRKIEGERALVVSHGLIISYYVSTMADKSFEEIRMGNCDIAVFKNDGDKWVFDHIIRNEGL